MTAFKKNMQLLGLFTAMLAINQSIQTRDARRPVDIITPKITVTASDPCLAKSWMTASQTEYSPNQSYYLLNNFLRLKPIKNGFDAQFFQQNYLPQDLIHFRDHSGIVQTSTLSKLANEVIEAIKMGQRDFKHFKILKDRDFNYATLSGLLVLKYKDYPFVIKISIEHPHTIIKPFSKSYEAAGMFVVGGNLRHLSNFTRIMNLKRIQKILFHNPFYIQNIDFPRKWYWLPDCSYDLKIEWSCNHKHDVISIPSIYAVISDFIETESQQPQNELNKLSMKVARDVGFLIDPHAGNMVVEKNTRKYILLDTEDFRLMTGLSASMNANKYIGWWIEMIGTSAKTCFLRTKKQRLQHSTCL